MPRIVWTALPPGVRNHLLDRVRLREIQAGEIAALLEWINTNPEVPEGEWCKDFGSFKLVGQGVLPKTFLTREQPRYGARI